MLLPRPRSRPNERRKLTLDLDEKPGDPQTTPAAQELLCNDEHRSGASMCSACSRSTTWLLALMKSAGRLPNHVIALEAL
jgi:hypothetical protein